MSTPYAISDAICDLKAGLGPLHFTVGWQYRHYGGREEIEWEIYTKADKFTRGPNLRACVTEAMEKHRAQAAPDTPTRTGCGAAMGKIFGEGRRVGEGGEDQPRGAA